ncbi:hypothetical protein GCM10010468_74010 [Actinocorallia longicatena]|uniref:Uncharacterized protein n=1 Tax=Actinocorallia longicatena TaxID=111803 RepID=A0ABP6QM44_9ACTN
MRIDESGGDGQARHVDRPAGGAGVAADGGDAPAEDRDVRRDRRRAEPVVDFAATEH